jgi:hypothetical protein
MSIIALTTITTAAFSQSPAALRNTPKRPESVGTGNQTRSLSNTEQEQVAAARNPYVTAQVGYMFGDGTFASNMITAGGFLYDIDVGQNDDGRTTKFGLPVRGNLAPILAAGLDKTGDTEKAARDKAIQDLLVSAQGIRVALEPWVQIAGAKDDSKFRSTLYASAGWKLNAVKDPTDTTRYLPAGRMAAGLDFGVGRTKDGRLPLLITLSPVYSVYATGDYKKVPGLKKAYASGELTIVVPVASNAALMTETIVAAGRSPVWHVGLLTVAASQKAAPAQ